MIISFLLDKFVSQKGSCSKITGINKCYYDYSIGTYDNIDYGVDWTSYSSTSSYSQTVTQAFMYSSSSSLNSKPYIGKYGDYLGGGYAFQIDTSSLNVSTSQQVWTDLQLNNWIDQRTRALFVEFTLYNVNLDLFAYCTILFEILPTGSLVASLEFNPMSLYTEESTVIVAFDILYLCLTVFLILREVQLMIKHKKRYLTQWWSYVNWLIIIFSWVAFGMYMYRLYEKNNLMSQLKANNGQVVNFQTLNYWTNLMLLFMAICCFLGSVKLIKVFGFSRNIRMIIRVFKECFIEMVGFLIIYIILMLAFTQMMYLMVYDRNEQFKSFAASLMTGFLMIIGKFNVDSFTHDSGGVLGTLVFSLFVVTMVLTLLNMFITLLSDRFSKIRSDYKTDHKDEDSLMLEYAKANILPIVHSILNKFKKKEENDAQEPSNQKIKMKNVPDTFESKASELIHRVNIKTKQKEIVLLKV